MPKKMVFLRQLAVKQQTFWWCSSLFSMPSTWYRVFATPTQGNSNCTPMWHAKPNTAHNNEQDPTMYRRIRTVKWWRWGM